MSKGTFRTYPADNTLSKQDKIRFELSDLDTVVVDIGWNLRSNKDYTNVLKSNGGYWNEFSRNWRVPKEKKAKLIEEFQDLIKKEGRPNYTIEDIPFYVDNFLVPITSPFKFRVRREGQAQGDGYAINYQLEKESMRSFEDLRLEIRVQLYDFQKDGIKYGIEKLGRVLIADEMGVGKTIQALALCAAYYEEWPALIIVPSSLRYNWEKEAKIWLSYYFKNEDKDEVHVLWKKSDGLGKKAKIVIISYDLAKDLSKEIEARLFHVVVCDEAHYMKNLDTQRTKFILPILQKAKRCILLTGTPALARPFELYPLLTAVRPDIFKDPNQYGMRYCDPTYNRFSKRKEYMGCDHDVELNLILQNVMIRRLKKDVLKDLPPKIRQVRDIKGDPKVIKEIKELMKTVEKETGMDATKLVEKLGGMNEGGEGANRHGGGGSTPGFSMMSVSQKIYDLTAKAKLESVIEVLQEFEEYKMKLVIFAYHKSMLDRLEQYAKEMEKKYNRKYIRICGETSAQSRGVLVEKFMKEPDCYYAILGLTAASVGLTLTQSRTVIFVELYWTPATMFQAEDRVHRIGQNSDSVYVIYLIAKDTLDQAMFDMLKNKTKTTGKILDGDNAQTLTYANVSKKNDGTLGSFFGSKPPVMTNQDQSMPTHSFAGLKEMKLYDTDRLTFKNISKYDPFVRTSKESFQSITEADLKELDDLEDIEQLVRTKVKLSPENISLVTSRHFDEEKIPSRVTFEVKNVKEKYRINEEKNFFDRNLDPSLIEKEIDDIEFEQSSFLKPKPINGFKSTAFDIEKSPEEDRCEKLPDKSNSGFRPSRNEEPKNFHSDSASKVKPSQDQSRSGSSSNKGTFKSPKIVF
jgi:SNF2 family DNA or RNA helicase